MPEWPCEGGKDVNAPPEVDGSIQDLDPSGNVIYSTTRQLDPTSRTMGENVSPAPTSFSIPDATMTFDADNRLNNFNGQSVSFDADSNMTSGPSAITLNGIAYGFDARNRLASAGNVTCNYNPDGRRTSLSDATLNPNGVSITFVIDPNVRLDRMLARNKGGNVTCYVYGLGLIGQEQNGIYQNYHFDSRGSTVAMTDAKGVVTDRFEYDSYGESLSHTGTSDTPFQFNGQYGVQTDPNGLLYMRARYYNPAIRRFINQDVLFGNINPGISLNRFAYANGNPISLMDPFGLCAQSDDARFNTDPLGYPTLEDWQVMFNDLTNLWNAYLAWTQGTRAWIEQNLPWLGDLIENLDEGSKYALIGEMSVEEGGMVPLEPPAEGGTVESVLMPGGNAIGNAGSQAAIREVSGSLSDAQSFFNQLSAGGEVVLDSTYPGTLVRLPNGGTVGIRTSMSESLGTAATIDVNIPGIPIKKIKFNP